MQNNFSKRLKKIKEELLALKTASEYTSIRNVVATHSGTVYTGSYKITYESSSEPIFSQIYSGLNKNSNGTIMLRTPQSGYQIVDVDTTYAVIEQGSATPVTFQTSFVVISNIPVVSIERI